MTVMLARILCLSLFCCTMISSAPRTFQQSSATLLKPAIDDLWLAGDVWAAGGVQKEDRNYKYNQGDSFLSVKRKEGEYSAAELLAYLMLTAQRKNPQRNHVKELRFGLSR
ncbi:uncharacterized protein LOC111088476 [Limulus polyphemus]|uniref:Uncharacterized protein LOC111088476 n=1 Tax=Limulus polyphemus TaxID=6850 RepID=A0ABM1TEX4_LIMPO|nr:uncharacterized protein LOC111088476 [Limulus polyphemus]